MYNKLKKHFLLVIYEYFSEKFLVFFSHICFFIFIY